MDENQERIKKLEEIIQKYKDNPSRQKLVEGAQAEIRQLKGESTPKPTPQPQGDTEFCAPAISEALQKISEAIALMEGSGGAGVDAQAVRKILADSKIDLSQLSPEIIEYINKNKKITFEFPDRIPVEMEGELPEIFWIAKSDLESSNNVFLYGGAGTGKTYISNQLAKALNCTLITINCNQYTSPLEIIGGQTIDGYQEGKLITAWGNLMKSAENGVAEGMKEGTSGCLLLLDELPKIDPNTAGLLNDALAKIKDTGEKSIIQNARGNSFEKKRFYCIATGNSRLNEESADYVANFRQDLSLQDRFAGSTYQVFVDLNVEAKLMTGFLFIFNFMNKVRNIITSDEGIRRQLGSKAFVSIRIMESLRDTWGFWYKNHTLGETKTLEQGVISFFNLFTDAQKQYLITESKYADFVKVVSKKANEPFGTDSAEDKKEAERYIKEYNDLRDRRRQGA
jgi:cobaltochelatase CobS